MKQAVIALGVSALVLVLAGCAAPRQDVTCRDKIVTVNHAPGSIVVPPREVEVDVKAGCALTLNIRPAVKANAARTKEERAKNPHAAPWLNEATQEGAFIRIHVPEGTPTGDYKYSIYIDDVGMLDPIIRVTWD
jgi:hypothetical protein